MPYTVGAGTTDDITYTPNQTMMAAESELFVCMWIRPTTLTANRVLWSCGNTANCAQIHSTTSEVAMLTNDSTGASWHTTGAALATNKWTFLAFLVSLTTTGSVAVAWRVWMGTVDTPPVEITVAQDIAPSGTFTGSTSHTLGNRGIASVAFQGDICQAVWMANAALAAAAPMAPVAAHGAITQAEADVVRDHYVIPFWLGDYAKMLERRPSGQVTNNRWFEECALLDVVTGVPQTAVTPEIVPTRLGVTISQNGSPRPPISRPGWPLIRR